MPIDQAGLTAGEADSGAVPLTQRFGSAANLNIHLHRLVLDGVYRRGTECELVFVEACVSPIRFEQDWLAAQAKQVNS